MARNRQLTILTLGLAAALIISTLLNIVSLHQVLSTSLNTQQSAENSSNFEFLWGPDSQTIVNGTFRLTMNLTLDENNLSITVKANNQQPSISRSINLYLIFFGSNTTEVYKLEGGNTTIIPIYFDPATDSLRIPWGYERQRGPQNVTYNPAEGHTFAVKFPWVDQKGTEWNPARLLKKGSQYLNKMELIYNTPYGGISVRFEFSIPETS